MGIEKDFIMRQLMMLFEVIHKILRYRKKGEEEEAQEQIAYFYSCLKIDDEVSELNIEDLVRFLEKEKKFTNDQIELVAFVIKEQGEMAENKDQQIDYFRKAFFFLEKVERESISFSMDRQMKLAELRGYLS